MQYSIILYSSVIALGLPALHCHGHSESFNMFFKACMVKPFIAKLFFLHTAVSHLCKAAQKNTSFLYQNRDSVINLISVVGKRNVQ